MNRRTLLRAGVGLTASLASGRSKATTPTIDCSCDMPLVEAALYCEKDACIGAAEDFGSIISTKPRAVLTPSSSVDIAAAVRSAPSRNCRWWRAVRVIRPMAAVWLQTVSSST